MDSYCQYTSIYSCLVPNCGPLSPPPNGSVITRSSTTACNVALYLCDDGLVLSGSTVRFCDNNGLWIPDIPTCKGQHVKKRNNDLESSGQYLNVL